MLDTMEDRPPIITVKDSPSPSTGGVTPQLESTKPQMFRFLSNIFKVIVPRDHTGSGFDEWPASLERADGGLEIGKALRAVVSILQYLREKSPAIIAPATKVLADGSRYGKLAMVVSEVLQEEELLADMRSEPWRLPFGDEKMLDFYLDLLAADEIEHDWTSDALRLIGNTCADLGSYRDKFLPFTATDRDSRHQSRACTCQAEAASLARSVASRGESKHCHRCAM